MNYWKIFIRVVKQLKLYFMKIWQQNLGKGEKRQEEKVMAHVRNDVLTLLKFL